jgi:O-antigen ligase
MREVFSFSFGDENALLRYANQLTFASRLVYWQAGWEVFNRFPWLGMGLGNAGFYFPQTLSGYAWGLVEVRDLMFRSDILLNIKSFWVRLLAETGIIGFTIFAAWLYLIIQTTRRLAHSVRPMSRSLGLAVQFVLIAFLIEGFSVDTFAFPYLWISTGLVTAASFIEMRYHSTT